jgi:hypothetical protein
MRIAASVALALLVVLEMFQIALAAGAPFGRAAWGGSHDGVLPTGLRVASAVNALVVYPLIALAILSAGGYTSVEWLPGDGPGVLWGLTVFFAIGTVANLASRSKLEKLWAPVVLGLAVCSGILAAGL